MHTMKLIHRFKLISTFAAGFCALCVNAAADNSPEALANGGRTASAGYHHPATAHNNVLRQGVSFYVENITYQFARCVNPLSFIVVAGPGGCDWSVQFGYNSVECDDPDFRVGAGTIYTYTDSTCTNIKASTRVDSRQCLGGPVQRSYYQFSCISQPATPSPTPSTTPLGSYVRTTTFAEPGCTGTTLETRVVFGACLNLSEGYGISLS